jgi:Tetratricopeptide repeat
LLLGENRSIQNALGPTEHILALHKDRLGENYADTLDSMHNLAIDYSEAGRGDEALELKK